MTQRRIAELAGVSQAVVSLVLNGKADQASRIPVETRLRVEQVIAETGYTADPAARRLAGAGNKIIGVFTYEPAFPTEAQDFYAPLLAGIEAEAEAQGCDLLMFTSAPVVHGRRRLRHPGSRLRLADGCLLLGATMDHDELAGLLDEGYPFVAVGRRDVPGVPYVGVDYVAGAVAVLDRVLAAGHRDLAYLHLAPSAESSADRRHGIRQGCAAAGATLHEVQVGPEATDLAAAVGRVRSAGASAVVTETPAQAEAVWRIAGADGVSVAALGEGVRPDPGLPDLTRLSPPRTRLGVESLRLLGRLLDPGDEPTAAARRTLLACTVVDGATVRPPLTGRARPR